MGLLDKFRTGRRLGKLQATFARVRISFYALAVIELRESLNLEDSELEHAEDERVASAMALFQVLITSSFMADHLIDDRNLYQALCDDLEKQFRDLYRQVGEARNEFARGDTSRFSREIEGRILAKSGVSLTGRLVTMMPILQSLTEEALSEVFDLTYLQAEARVRTATYLKELTVPRCRHL